MRRAVVFDLDGTLVDSVGDIRAAINQVLEAAGRSALDRKTVTGFVGDGARQLVARAFSATGGAVADGVLDRHYRAFLGAYESEPVALTRPYPGALQALLALKAEGRALGVCTNKPDALTAAVLSRLGLAVHFDAIVGPDRVTRRKPDPAHLLATLDAMGAGANDAVMVGDSANDVEVARGAGVPAICVTFGYARGAPKDLGADALIDHFRELPAAIAALD
jgi:phosphoglycolate phosphatase